MRENKQVRPCKVAILMVEGQPYHAKAVTLLLEQLCFGVPEVYLPQVHKLTSFEKETVKAKVRYLVQSGMVDLLYTIGEMCTVYAKEVADEVGGFPIVFVGVRDPAGSGLVATLDKPGAEISGVVRHDAPPSKWVEAVGLFSPKVKQIFMPYLIESRSATLACVAREVKEGLAARGIEVFAVPIKRDIKQLTALLEEYSGKVQGVLVLDGCYANILQNNISWLCWQKMLVFFGSNVASIDVGASCALSGDMNQLVAESYKKMRRYWEGGVPLSTMPITVLPDNRDFYVNVDMLRRIGFPDELLFDVCSSDKIKAVRRWVSPPKHL